MEPEHKLLCEVINGHGFPVAGRLGDDHFAGANSAISWNKAPAVALAQGLAGDWEAYRSYQRRQERDGLFVTEAPQTDIYGDWNGGLQCIPLAAHAGGRPIPGDVLEAARGFARAYVASLALGAVPRITRVVVHSFTDVATDPPEASGYRVFPALPGERSISGKRWPGWPQYQNPNADFLALALGHGTMPRTWESVVNDVERGLAGGESGHSWWLWSVRRMLDDESPGRIDLPPEVFGLSADERRDLAAAVAAELADAGAGALLARLAGAMKLRHQLHVRRAPGLQLAWIERSVNGNKPAVAAKHWQDGVLHVFSPPRRLGVGALHTRAWLEPSGAVRCTANNPQERADFAELETPALGGEPSFAASWGPAGFSLHGGAEGAAAGAGGPAPPGGPAPDEPEEAPEEPLPWPRGAGLRGSLLVHARTLQDPAKVTTLQMVRNRGAQIERLTLRILDEESSPLFGSDQLPLVLAEGRALQDDAAVPALDEGRRIGAAIEGLVLQMLEAAED